MAVALLGLGCVDRQSPIETGGTDETHEDVDTLLQLTVNKDVDILFVIDNSASMGEAQANLVAGVDALIDVLEDPEVAANYRIGVTTTDNGNPSCAAATTTPESGQLVLSSCKTRLDDFVMGNAVDVRDLACNDLCNLSPAELEILPTATDRDPDLVPRPWLENILGRKNLPAETEMAEAFRCFGPQGINGCGFESPLESMYLALDRALTEMDPNYGFMRDGAVLVIVIVTNEDDCSYVPTWAEIFALDGNRVFWSDPLSLFPSSAVCWNAGVECSGDPSGYDGCEPVDKDVDGNVDVGEAEAVLHPLSRYVERLEEIEDSKQQLNPNREVIVTVIGGVSDDGSVFYADALDDPEFQNEFGIGPGCSAASGAQAVPPARLRVFSDTITPANMFSICNSDPAPAFQAIVDQLRDQIRPACWYQCAADTNPQTEVLEPDCVVVQLRPGFGEEPLVECERDPATMAYVMPSDDVDVCYALLVDPGGVTSDPADDMSPECVDFNYNLEFEIVRRPGVPATGGTAVAAHCSVDQFPAVTCPNFGMEN